MGSVLCRVNFVWLGEKFSTRVRPVLDPLTGEERQAVAASALVQNTLHELPHRLTPRASLRSVLRATAAAKCTSAGALGGFQAGGPAGGDVQGCSLGEGWTPPGTVGSALPAHSLYRQDLVST